MTAFADYQVVGDDLTSTNVTRVIDAIEDRVGNELRLLKVNQIGSITLSIDGGQDVHAVGLGRAQCLTDGRRPRTRRSPTSR